MIRVQILSDIHGEFGTHALPARQDLQTNADIIVLAGDIARAPDTVRVVSHLFPEERPVVLVGGNHEHYKTGLTVDQGNEIMHEAAAVEPRIHVLENEELILNVCGVALRVLGATFWTDFALNSNIAADAEICRRVVNDHQAIAGTDGGRFSPAEAIRRHAASSRFLADKLDQWHEGPTIVVTHHLPSIRSISKRFLGPISSAFASNADGLVSRGAALWIHGHTHDSQRWRDDSGTLVVCNPAGYVQRNGTRENSGFQPRLCLGLDQASDGRWRVE